MTEPVRRCRHRIRLFIWQLMSMPEYSCTLPTGTTLWKMWRRDVNQNYNLAIAQGRLLRQAMDEPEIRPKPVEWWVGQYVPHADPDKVGIKWFEVQLLEGPEPALWQVPDWDNYERYKRERAEERKQNAARNG